MDARYISIPFICLYLDDLLTQLRMLKDDRVRKDAERSIFNIKDAYERLG